jgi:pimeloyl-ACP methyl ester carboxylesterase
VSRRLFIALGAFVVIALAAAFGWAAFDRANLGIPGFYVWKAVSGRAGGAARANLDGVQIYYETFGRGPPVLVLHGGTAFLETMHYQIEALSGTHRVIAPDSRGHGRSTDAPGPLHYRDMSEDMVGLMDRLQIRKVDIVGWSDGGIVGLDLAMRHPDRVGRLVAIGANFNVAGLVGSGLAPGADSPSPAVAAARAFYQSIAPDPGHWPVFYAKVMAMWRSEPDFALSDLARIQAPTLIIAGEADAIRRDHTDALTRAIPGAKEVILAGDDHMAPLKDPRAVDAAVVKFLAQ